MGSMSYVYLEKKFAVLITEIVKILINKNLLNYYTLNIIHFQHFFALKTRCHDFNS